METTGSEVGCLPSQSESTLSGALPSLGLLSSHNSLATEREGGGGACPLCRWEHKAQTPKSYHEGPTIRLQLDFGWQWGEGGRGLFLYQLKQLLVPDYVK